MSYRNKLVHPTFGEVWFKVTLNNWNCLDHNEEANLRMGPLVEVVCRDYLVSAQGQEIGDAIESLNAILDWYEEECDSLPRERDVKVRRHWVTWLKWKLWRNRALRRRTNPVRDW